MHILRYLRGIPSGHHAPRLYGKIFGGILSQTASTNLQGISLYQSRSETSANGFRWLHPAGPTIERLDAASKFGQLTPIAHMTLNSATPLKEEHFEDALRHLCRKLPTFRTCLRQREGELWVCEYAEPKIDFKMMTNADLKEEINRLLLHTFPDSSAGPLWCSLAIPAHPDAPCPLPEIKGKFPHQYDFLILVHHAISDGSTIMVTFIQFLKLLEDVISGIPVEPEPVGAVVGEQQTMALEREMLKSLESKPQEFQRMIDEAAKVKFTPLLQQAFGTPSKPEFPVDVVSTELNPRILMELHEKCRSIGITMNSAMSSIVNTALVQLVAEKGLVKDTYSVTSRHAIDQRRYWKGDRLTVLGNHMGAMSHTMETPLHNRAAIWDYAKQFDDQFRRKLKEGHIFKERIIRSKIRPQDYSHESFYSSTPATIYDYMLSNMFMPNFSNVGIGKKIQMTSIKSFDNISNCEYSNMHFLISFRDSVKYHILFSTGRVSRETAEAFMEKIKNVIYSVTQ